MKIYLLRLFADKFALVADVTNPRHVKILHWIKNQVQRDLLLRAAIAEGYIPGVRS